MKNAYYKLNITDESFTSKINYSHKVDLAYKFYQIKSMKERKYKIARQFALRRIINNKYSEWLDESEDKNKTFYKFLERKGYG